MFVIDKWLGRRVCQRKWEKVLIDLTNGSATAPVNPAELASLYDVITETLFMYSNRNCINKQTLRLIFFLKRVLADKRQFDTIKALEYLVAGHTIYKKRFLNKEAKERLIAHHWQMVILYRDMVMSRRTTNPFAPGLALGETHE